jgi:UDP-N-acetylmuramate dehydrogenase
MFQRNVFLRDFSSFAIGGKANFFKRVNSIVELKKVLKIARKEGLKVFILGKGTNCLFDDRGFSGLIVQSNLNFCRFYSKRVVVGSGVSLSKLSKIAGLKGVRGLEFALSIPGSIGGALYMNAGAFGKTVFDFLERVKFVELNGEEKIFYKRALKFSYRYSSFQEMKGIIVSASFIFEKSKNFKIEKSFLERRKKTQPLNERSLGCIFKNPKEKSAGFLIESCGLKGKSIGGAKVSEKHANFIINKNSATSLDVLRLISLIKREVKKKYKIELEEEILIVPYNGEK